MDERQSKEPVKFRLDTERFQQEVAEEIAASLRERGRGRTPQSSKETRPER